MLTLASVSDAPNNVVADLVSAFDRALEAVKSSGRSTRAGEGEDGLRKILAEFDALGGPERDQVAHALTLLWDAFNERFNGLHGFLFAEFSDRFAYTSQLERAVDRLACCGHRAAHYYHATALMLAYVKALSQQQSLGSRLIEAIHRGRVLSREGALEVSTVRQVAAPVFEGSFASVG